MKVESVVLKKRIETLKKASITREDDEVTKLLQTALDEGKDIAVHPACQRNYGDPRRASREAARRRKSSNSDPDQSQQLQVESTFDFENLCLYLFKNCNKNDLEHNYLII